MVEASRRPILIFGTVSREAGIGRLHSWDAVAAQPAMTAAMCPIVQPIVVGQPPTAERWLFLGPKSNAWA